MRPTIRQQAASRGRVAEVRSFVAVDPSKPIGGYRASNSQIGYAASEA